MCTVTQLKCASYLGKRLVLNRDAALKNKNATVRGEITPRRVADAICSLLPACPCSSLHEQQGTSRIVGRYEYDMPYVCERSLHSLVKQNECRFRGETWSLRQRVSTLQCSCMCRRVVRQIRTTFLRRREHIPLKCRCARAHAHAHTHIHRHTHTHPLKN
jgi:hypothetical protein